MKTSACRHQRGQSCRYVSVPSLDCGTHLEMSLVLGSGLRGPDTFAALQIAAQSPCGTGQRAAVGTGCQPCGGWGRGEEENPSLSAGGTEGTQASSGCVAFREGGSVQHLRCHPRALLMRTARPRGHVTYPAPLSGQETWPRLCAGVAPTASSCRGDRGAARALRTGVGFPAPLCPRPGRASLRLRLRRLRAAWRVLDRSPGASLRTDVSHLPALRLRDALCSRDQSAVS